MFSGSPDLELIIISVNFPLSKIVTGLFYRPPNAPSPVFDNLLTSLCTHVDVSLFSNFILLGDFNVNFLNPQHPLFCKLRLITSSLCHTQVFSEPTHISLSSPSNLISCATIPELSNSDHLGLSLISAGKPLQTPKRNCRKVWRYSHANFELACELLDTTDWDCIFTGDVNSSWINWQMRFLHIMEQCIPQVILRSRKNLPWLTKSILQAIRKKNILFRVAKKCKSTTSYQKYRAARNKVSALLRFNKTKFFKELGHSSQKEFWKSIKLLNQQDSSIPTLHHDDSTVESDLDKAVLLNNFFFDCFNKSVPPLPDHHPSLDQDSCPQALLCTEDKVLELLLSLDITKSTGPDDISARMLKGTATSIAPSLTHLLNLSLISGTFPDAWKLARVVPVPKSSDRSSPSSYRLISIQYL